jgi:hypothetical protein
MRRDQKDYNQLELETIATPRAEGHDVFEEMAGPPRRRMSDQTDVRTRPTPWLARFSVTAAGLSLAGLLFILEFTG